MSRNCCKKYKTLFHGKQSKEKKSEEDKMSEEKERSGYGESKRGILNIFRLKTRLPCALLN